MNRFQKPAYWAIAVAHEGLTQAVLATWGKVRVEPLESEAASTPVSGFIRGMFRLSKK